MLRQLFITCLVAVLPIAAHATSTASIINTSCSGNLTSSLIDGASFACAGNLTLDGGFIISDTDINILADGDLFIDRFDMKASNIKLSSILGQLNIGSGALIQANSSILLYANSINIALGAKTEIVQVGKIVLVPNTNLITNAGGDINVTSGEFSLQGPVPEPSVYAMILFGLSLITFKRRTNR